MKRRGLLSSVALSVFAVGCVGDSSLEADAESTTSSTTTPRATETPPTRTSIPTNTCDEQSIQSDLAIENETDEPRTVTVEVRAEDGSQTLFEYTDELEASETVQVDEKLFESANPNIHNYVAHVESGGVVESATVTTATKYPTTYGIMVTIFGDSLSVREYHGDPSPAYNPDCY